MAHTHHSHQGGSENIEKRDVRFGGIMVSLGALTLFIASSIIICVVCFKGLEWYFKHSDKGMPDMFVAQMTPAEPRLQAAPALDMVKYKEEQRNLAGSYAVMDPAAGMARIPVTRAIEMIAEKPDIFHQEKMEPKAEPKKESSAAKV